ncbi:hypothetical protein EDC53_102487 [Phytobacter diazotrophicus]|nr:hypothetical protein EDC53_102487 [Phytobacter diazotrophicus]
MHGDIKTKPGICRVFLQTVDLHTFDGFDTERIQTQFQGLRGQ